MTLQELNIFITALAEENCKEFRACLALGDAYNASQHRERGKGILMTYKLLLPDEFSEVDIIQNTMEQDYSTLLDTIWTKDKPQKKTIESDPEHFYCMI